MNYKPYLMSSNRLNFNKAATAPTQDRAASSGAMNPTTSRAAPSGAPTQSTSAPTTAPILRKAASPTKPRGNTAASTGPSCSTTTIRPSVSTDAPLGAASKDTIEMTTLKDVISEGPPEPTWSLVSSRKKQKNKKPKQRQQAAANPQAGIPAREKVAEGGPRHQPGAKSSAQVGKTSGQAERTQAQATHPATPATSGGNQPPRRSKPRGKRAGKLAKQSHPIPQTTTGKRSRPDDSTTPTGDGKRARAGSSQTRVSYAAAFKANELCVAVMTEPFYDLTPEQANGIRKCLEKQLVDDLLNPSTADHMADIGFRGKAHFGEGALKMWCEDDASLEWLRRAVANLASPIAGSKLVVKPQSEIQRRILCGLLVPELTLDIDNIRQILTAHNSKFVNIRTWMLVKAERQTESETPGVYLLLRIPESDVDKLKQRERRLKWMFGNIYVRILEEETGKNSAKGTAPTPAQPTQTPPAPERVDTNPPECQPEGMDMNVDPPSTPKPDEDHFLDVEGSEASDSCLNSSPLRAS